MPPAATWGLLGRPAEAEGRARGPRRAEAAEEGPEGAEARNRTGVISRALDVPVEEVLAVVPVPPILR
eukprot:7773844-Alexandrium_andersonii.AAC.1